MLTRDNFECQLKYEGCTGYATHHDHIVPVTHGGRDTMENSQAACENCNLKKGADG